MHVLYVICFFICFYIYESMFCLCYFEYNYLARFVHLTCFVCVLFLHLTCFEYVMFCMFLYVFICMFCLCKVIMILSRELSNLYFTQLLSFQLTSDTVRRKKIIAMTITGASIHNMLLKELQPDILIVEEAAEILGNLTSIEPLPLYIHTYLYFKEISQSYVR